MKKFVIFIFFHYPLDKAKQKYYNINERLLYCQKRRNILRTVNEKARSVLKIRMTLLFNPQNTICMALTVALMFVSGSL